MHTPIAVPKNHQKSVHTTSGHHATEPESLPLSCCPGLAGTLRALLYALDVTCLWGLQEAGPLLNKCLHAVGRSQVGSSSTAGKLQ